MNLLIFIGLCFLIILLWEFKSVNEIFSITPHNYYSKYTFNSYYLSSILVVDEMNIRDETKNFVIKKNEMINIILDSNPTTGYSWNFSIDESYIKLVSKDFYSDSKKL